MDNSVVERLVDLICKSCPSIELLYWLKSFDRQPPPNSVDVRTNLSAQCINIADISMPVKVTQPSHTMNMSGVGIAGPTRE